MMACGSPSHCPLAQWVSYFIAMSNKVTTAVKRAADNFASGDIQPTDGPAISEAQARGLPEPVMSAPEKAGINVRTQLAARYLTSLNAHEKFMQEKADYLKARDDALYSAIQARAKAAL
jgi:hypothetical protein